MASWPFPQRFVEPGVIQQDVFHAVLNRRGVQGLRAHQVVRVEGAHDGVELLGFEVGRIGELLLGVVRGLLPERF